MVHYLYILASKNHHEYTTNAAMLYYKPPQIKSLSCKLHVPLRIERDSWHSWKIF